jgi:hypothetical protein
MHRPPENGPSLFDLVPQVKPLDGSVAVQPGQPAPGEFGHGSPAPLPVEGRFHPPVNYVSDEEES